MSTNLRVSTSGKFCEANDIASGAQPGLFVQCVPSSFPGQPNTVQFASAIAAQASVPNIAALVALTGVGFGQKIRVETVGRSYEFTPPGVSPLSGIDVLAGVNGDWHTLYGTSDQKWRAQATWSIDPVNGNDEASGLDDANALKTADEIQLRWGPGRPKVSAASVTIRVLGALDSMCLTAQPGASTLLFSVVGVPQNIIAATTLASYAKYSHATPEATIITAAAVADWTPLLSARIRSGATGALLAWVAKVNPAGGGINTARVSPFGSQGTAGSRLWTQSDPIVGNALFVESLPVVHQLSIDLRGSGPASGVQLLVQDLAFDGEVFLTGNESVRTRVYGCALLPNALENVLDFFTNGLARIHACRMSQTQQSDRVYYAGCYHTTGILTGLGVSTMQSCLVQGIAGYGISGAGSQQTLITDTQVFDCTSGLVHPQTAGVIGLTNVSGSTASANATGIDLAQGTIIETSGTLKLLAAAGVEVHFHGFPKAYAQGAIHWSDIPANGFALGKWFGTDTLNAGAKLVALVPALTSVNVGSKVQVGYVVPKAAAPAIGYTGVTTAGFTATNGDAGDNTSTFWFSVESSIPRVNSIIPLSLS